MTTKGNEESKENRRDEVSEKSALSSCGCKGGCCGSSSRELGRRRFLQVAGVGLLSTTLGGRLAGLMAGPFGAEETSGGALIPEDKKLAEEWVKKLFERGIKDIYTGKSLENIGMPCCGIGTGQLYLRGDGTLGCWQIFNNAQSNWVGDTNSTYLHRGVDQPVDQGFAIEVEQEGSAPLLKCLSREDFPGVSFQGDYPIALVKYAEPGFPVKVEMEAFSPFIPLNAKDSGLPATLFHLSVENISDKAITASVVGWLQNAVCYSYAAQYLALRNSKFATGAGYSVITHSAEEPPKKAEEAKPKEERPVIIFETFEGDSYGAWTIDGAAFGTKPASGALDGQQPVSGFEGKGLVNSFLGGDVPQGTLTSPPFIIQRRFINFLIGGGQFKDATCVNLVIDGKPARTAMGSNNETLTWKTWAVEALEGKEARIEIADKSSGGWGHINLDQIEFSDAPRACEKLTLDVAPDFGTMSLACLEAASPETALVGPLPPNRPGEEFIANGAATYDGTGVRRALLKTTSVKLAPGEKHVFTYAVSWSFPNQLNGHEYNSRFSDSAEVIEYLFRNHERLTNETRLWRDSFYDSTLPYWLLDRLHSTVSYLCTGTSQWWKNGRFWAYEGVNCCEGTCTHVWNYAHAQARLFPELSRSAREMQDFNPRENGGGFHPNTGLVGFRSDDKYAADGQCGTVLKAYREHLMSADDAFLKRNWPSIKKALEFSMSHDGNDDGLIEDLQHNTYDINYFGANTFVGSLYLAALRAGEEMAKLVGDEEFAKRARLVFESGANLSAKKLWNGEYFEQDVDLKEHPQHQYKNGCLSDQLFGQSWAHQVNLGYIYPKEIVLKALDSIWKYNWTPDVGPYNAEHKPFRWFITPGQAGLIICTWPKGGYLTEGTLYREEVWTGIEYQVAAHMIVEGKTLEGLAICRAVHDRYHPDLYNPYNEVECGDHYARAMASWGVYHALAGFQYNGPKGELSFAPKISQDNFRATFTTAEAWIAHQTTCDKDKQNSSIEVKKGSLRLTSLSFAARDGAKSPKATLNGTPFKAKLSIHEGTIRIEFKDPAIFNAGDRFEVEA